MQFRLTYRLDDSRVANVNFAFYKIGTADKDENIFLESPYKELLEVKEVDIKESNLNGDCASLLSACIAAEQIEPNWKGKTDNDGVVMTPKLERGIYLYMGERTQIDRTTYTPYPIVIYDRDIGFLPLCDANGFYDCDVYYTSYITPIDPSNPSTKEDRNVLVVWGDAGNEDSRPQSMSVTLRKNGEAYDTCTLSQENDWTHTWDELSSTSVWDVVIQDSFDEYMFSIVQQGNTYVITMTYAEGIEPEEPPE